MPITEWAMYNIINVITGFMCITDDTILGFSTYASNIWITIIINNAHRPNCTPPLLIAIKIIGTDEIHIPNTGINQGIDYCELLLTILLFLSSALYLETKKS